MSIKGNIEARQLAELVYALAQGSAGDAEPGCVGRFWEVLATLVASNMPKAEQPKPMSDLQAKAFAKQSMRYGKYAGEPIENVPHWYLSMLVDDDEFKADLRRYLATDYMRRLVPAVDEGDEMEGVQA